MNWQFTLLENVTSPGPQMVHRITQMSSLRGLRISLKKFDQYSRSQFLARTYWHMRAQKIGEKIVRGLFQRTSTRNFSHAFFS